MSLSYAAHINGDKVYDIATGYWIEAKQEAAASAGRMQWSVYLYDDEGTFVEKYAGGGGFPEADKDKYLFAGFDMNINVSNASWRIFAQVLPSYSIIQSASGTSTTLKQYFSGEQGYAINADYAVIDVQPYSITENGTYTAPFSKAYSPVTVDVQEQPWQPLEDGYSNFWFELTNDTLSPWLNFSAKNDDAVIDWGDGSGEVALDTLTPTHTYAKAGKYVVKVKGVTSISRQHNSPYNGAYLSVLRSVELNNTVTTINGYGFMYCVCLENVKLPASITSIGNYSFYTTSVKKLQFSNGITSIAFNAMQFCFELGDISLPNSITVINGSAFQSCTSLTSITLPNALLELGNNAFQGCLSIFDITIPSTITSIGSYIFQACASLAEIHIQATVPPALAGSNHFQGLPSDYIIYVPVGTGETYKAASGWSAYADHILEEGQTPNRAMLSRLAKAVETDTDEDMR